MSICTIRTTNFDQMRDFYRDQLRLSNPNMIGDHSIWFHAEDFRIELHINRAISSGDVGVDGFLSFHGSDVVGISEMFRGRGVSVQVRNRGSTTESFITDPDENIILLVGSTQSEAPL